MPARLTLTGELSHIPTCSSASGQLLDSLSPAVTYDPCFNGVKDAGETDVDWCGPSDASFTSASGELQMTRIRYIMTTLSCDSLSPLLYPVSALS